MAITDQGLLFISDGFHGGQIAIDLTGNIFIPEAPAGFTNKPQIQGTSADVPCICGLFVKPAGASGMKILPVRSMAIWPPWKPSLMKSRPWSVMAMVCVR